MGRGVSKYAVPAAAAALVALAGVVAALRMERPPPMRAPSLPPAAPVLPPIPPAPEPKPAPASQATFQAFQALADPRATGEAAVEELVSLLARDPAGWRDVTEYLSGVEDHKAATRIGTMLAPAVDDEAEGVVLDLLRMGRTAAARRAAVAMLSRRSSLESLLAVLAAAREDPDSGVRLAALVEGHRRKASPPSGDAAALIEDTIRQRSLAEPDPNVRELVGRLLPGGAPPSPPPRAPKPSPLRGPRPAKTPPPPAAPGE